jgi:hypothetical protein
MHASGISVDVDDNAGEPFAYSIGIAHELFSMSLWIRRDELALFARVPTAVWDERGAVQIGVSAGARAFWCTRAETVSILVGHDDETWDFGVELPIALFHEIVDALERYSGERLRPPG